MVKRYSSAEVPYPYELEPRRHSALVTATSGPSVIKETGAADAMPELPHADVVPEVALDTNDNYKHTVISDGIHPPNVVTLSPVNDPEAPWPDSPLSTPPDSPRSRSSGEDEELESLAAPTAVQEMPRRPFKTAELLMERKSSSELPRVSPFEILWIEKQQQKEPTFSSAKTFSLDGRPFDEARPKKNQPTSRLQPSRDMVFSRYCTRLKEGDDDAPDDEKKVDDACSPTASCWREEQEEEVESYTAFLHRIPRGEMVNTTGTVSSAGEATPILSNLMAESRDADEIMGADGEPPSLYITGLQHSASSVSNNNVENNNDDLLHTASHGRAAFGSGTSISSPEEDGELPALSTAPSPPLELDLTSPESSSAASSGEDDPPFFSLLGSQPLDKSSIHQNVDRIASTEFLVAPSISFPAIPSRTIQAKEPSFIHVSDSKENDQVYTSVCGQKHNRRKVYEETVKKYIGLEANPVAISKSNVPGRRLRTLEDDTFHNKRRPADDADDPSRTADARAPERPKPYARVRSYGSSSTRNFIGVDRLQHLRFAALKRDIVSGKRQVQLNVVEPIDQLLIEPKVVRVGTSGKTFQKENACFEDGNNNSSYNDADFLFLRDGIKTLESPVSLHPTCETIDSGHTVHREDGSFDAISSGSIFVAKERHTIDGLPSHRLEGLHDLSQSDSERVIRSVRSEDELSSSPRLIRSVKSDGGSSSPSRKTFSGKISGYDRAWSDYLTFRGVVVQTPPDQKATQSAYGGLDVGRTHLATSAVDLSSEADDAGSSSVIAIASKNPDVGAVSERAMETSTAFARPNTVAIVLHSPLAEAQTLNTMMAVNSFTKQMSHSTPVESISQYANEEIVDAAHITSESLKKPHPSAFREMTPNKDLQGSERSSEWLQAELRRRAFIKREINTAIEERGKMTEALDLCEGPDAELKPRSGSLSEMDEEVAAINAEEENIELTSSIIQSPSDGRIPGNGSIEEEIHSPRCLFGKESLKDISAVNHAKGSDDDISEQVNYEDVQVEMKKFASDTRAALRDQSFTEHAMAASKSTGFIPVTVPNHFVTKPGAGAGDPSTAPSLQQMKSLDGSIARSTESTLGSKNAELNTANSELSGSEFVDLKFNETPLLIRSMDYFIGIAKGDITLSLLSENTGMDEKSVGATWANRVRGAIWRARRMRRNMKQAPESRHPRLPRSFTNGRSSFSVDVEQTRVRGSFRTVSSTQDAAILHLKHDEIDKAIELFEDIIFAYYSYFERSLSRRERNPETDIGLKPVDFQLYLGVALHNLGVLNLLKGDYHEAISFFTRAVENRRAHLGEKHPDHISSLAKLAVCRFALNEFAEAHARLEEALVFARRSCITIDDRMLMAEIFNNLGCLAYMCGQPVAANAFFRDSMDIQFGVLSDSLYAGTATWGQTISLNISITRANIGFIKLVTNQLPISITALENALMEQQILLKGAHDTIIATMDHLAVANLLYGDQEKAALMFSRILELQQIEYGLHDRRCHVTIDKINMVQSKGVQYEDAIEALHNIFTMPEATVPQNILSDERSKSSKGSKKSRQAKGTSIQKAVKQRKIRVLKVLRSIRKMKP